MKKKKLVLSRSSFNERRNAMKSRVILGIVLICFVCVFVSGLAGAQQKGYPNKPIDLVVPYNPGGGTDVTARILSMYLSKTWRVAVNVVNKPGGRGIPGCYAAISAKPDGYTMLCEGHATSSIMDAFSAEKLPFDWRKRTWICRQTVDVVFYLTRPDSPFTSLKGMEKYIKENPKELRWGESGIGLASGAQFFYETKIPLDMVKHVTFTGGAMTTASLAGSHIDFAAQQLSEIKGFVDAKKVRALAVIWPERVPQLPQVPTVVEEGFPTIDAKGWHGISGPPGLPKEIVDKWVVTLREAAESEMFKKYADAVYKVIAFLGPKEFREYVDAEHKKYLELAKMLKIKK